jgi:peptide/nickel transport system substrate-binding protein
MRFREWQQGVQIVLTRNEGYWRGPIPLEEATYRPAPEASTRVAMLETGQADIIANVPPELIPRIERGTGLSVQRTASLRKLFLEFNMRQKPFDDVRVRRAFNHAIDKEALINFVLGGNAIREYGPIPDGWLGSNPRSALTAYDYDPAKARQLLAEAGYASGMTIDFWHSIGRYLKDKEVAEAIVGQLSQVGVRSNVVGMDIGSLITRIHTQTLSGVHMFSWAPLIFDTDYLWRAHYYSKGLNQYAWDEKTDQLLTAGASSMDPKERNRLYSQLERYIVNDLVPWVFLYRQSLIYGTRTSVDRLPRADEVIDVRGIRVKR